MFHDRFRSIIKFSEQGLDAGMRSSFFSPRLMEVFILSFKLLLHAPYLCHSDKAPICSRGPFVEALIFLF